MVKEKEEKEKVNCYLFKSEKEVFNTIKEEEEEEQEEDLNTIE